MNIIKLDSINSTNTYCNYLLTNPAGLPKHLRPDAEVSLPVAVIACEQYAGRGRYGKTFFSPGGNGIYLSYAYEGSYSESDLLRITVVVAALVHQVLQGYCDEELSIKWVNDIYRGSRKIAGILTERVDDPTSDRYYIIVGVGVNAIPCEVPQELSDIIGFLSDDDQVEISVITDQLISTLDEHLGNCKVDSFSNLINYYKIHCRELPADFSNELFDL